MKTRVSWHLSLGMTTQFCPTICYPEKVNYLIFSPSPYKLLKTLNVTEIGDQLNFTFWKFECLRLLGFWVFFFFFDQSVTLHQ